MKDGKYCLSIVGFGGMGSWHAQLLRGEHTNSDGKGIENLQLEGVYDIKQERLDYAQSLNIKNYASLEEVLSDEIIDIILCATPNDCHKEIAIKSMRAGKHVICEKPVTLCSDDLQEMIDVSHETGKLFTVHQNRRWDEDFNVMKKIYEEGTIGDVFRIESRVHGSRGIPGDWRGKKEHGGGMMLDWGVHLLDQMLLAIPEKIKTIYCTYQHITNYEVDDGFTMIITFESGKEAFIEVGTSNFIELPRWYILGEDGTAIIYDWDLNGKIVSITDYDKNDAVPVQTAAGLTKTMAPRTEETIKETSLPSVDITVKTFYRNVISTISGEEEQIITHQQMMRVMRVMETAYESDRLKQVVTFKELD